MLSTLFGYLRAGAFFVCFCVVAGWHLILLRPYYQFVLGANNALWHRRPSLATQRATVFLLKYVLGITYHERGYKPILNSGQQYLFVMNHESYFEAMLSLTLIPNVVVMMKHEIVSFPLVGWYIRHFPMVPVNRKDGAGGLRQAMSEMVKEMTQGKRHGLIFPQGTTCPPDNFKPFKQGWQIIAKQTDAMVVPVVINSGDFWPGSQLKTRQGTITIEYFPALSLAAAGANDGKHLEDMMRESRNKLPSS